MLQRTRNVARIEMEQQVQKQNEKATAEAVQTYLRGKLSRPKCRGRETRRDLGVRMKWERQSSQRVEIGFDSCGLDYLSVKQRRLWRCDLQTPQAKTTPQTMKTPRSWKLLPAN